MLRLGRIAATDVVRYSCDMDAFPQGGRWILLIHHLPPKPDYLRVKVRRQLHRIGAVALKNSVYVMPHTDQSLEDVEWLRRMIVGEGGEAMVCTASLVDGVTDQEVEGMFMAQADEEYRRIVDAAGDTLSTPTAADLRRLKRQLADAQGRDFFHAAGAARAQRTVSAIERALAGERNTSAASAGEAGRAAPHNATWVTRRGVFIDRIASAWLIRRFVDPEAVFKFVAPKGYRSKPCEIRFDMFEGEFTHEGDRCTFEVLVQRFVPDDAVLVSISEIVHDVDIRDDKFGREEAAGVAALIRGIAATHEDDGARLAAGATFFDGLYAALS